MTLASDLKRFNEKVARREKEIFRGVVDAAYQSITLGSLVTGAPGQPVQSGDLLRSWRKRPEGDNNVAITTTLFYAQSIEDGVNLANGQLINLDSPIGGFHSLALTIMGFQRIVDTVTKEVVGSDA